MLMKGLDCVEPIDWCCEDSKNPVKLILQSLTGFSVCGGAGGKCHLVQRLIINL